jgi:hypothetical protein
VPALERAGVLAPTELARALECDSCGQGDVEPVLVADVPDCPRRWYILCPTDGPVWVSAERLRRWQVRPKVIGRLLTRVDPVERLPDRVWKLGPLRIGPQSQFGWLVAGWRVETGLSERVPELSQPNALVFVPNDLPTQAVWGPATPPRVIPLTDVLTLREAELTVDRAALAAHLPIPPVRPTGAYDVVLPLVTLPAGTTWEQVTLFVEDHHLVLCAGGHRARYGYEELGLRNKKSNAPSPAWHMLDLLARGRELAPTDGGHTKPGTLKNHLTELRKALRRLTGLTDDPFHPTLGCSRTARSFTSVPADRSSRREVGHS